MRFILCLSLLAWSSALRAQNPADEAVPTPAVRLEPVRVTSELDKQGAPLVTAPGSIVQKDRDQIRDRAPMDLKDVLDMEPNVEFNGGPRGAAEKPQIRGLGSERILILDEGVRQNFQNTHNGRAFSDFSLMEEVEVVKGPWSSLYGSGAMGGVISFRRATAADFVRRSGKLLGAEVAFDGATAANELGQRVTGFAKSGLFEPLLSYRHAQAGDVRLGDNSRLGFSGYERNDVYSSLGFDLGKKHSFTLKIDRFNETATQPLNAALDIDTDSQVAQTSLTKEDVVGDYRLQRGIFDLHAKPYVRRTRIAKARLNDARTDIQTVETVGADLWNNWTQTWSEDLTTITTFGVEGFQDRNTGERAGQALLSFPNGSGEQIGVYLQPSFKVGNKLTLTPGWRQDSYRLRDSTGQAVNSSGGRGSGKFYASYEYQPNQSVFAGWGQAFNAPRLQDLYITDMHFPGNFFVPNPDLKPESAETTEAGVKNRFRLADDQLLTFNGTYFVTRAKDFINRQVQATTTRFVNLNQVRLEGFEASAQWQSLNWGLGLAYGQVRSEDEDSHQPLADTPADQWSGKVESYLSEEITVGTEFKWALKQDRVPTGTNETPSYETQDFFLRYQTRAVNALLRVNNAFDRDYRRHGSQVREVGRDVRASISYLF